MADIDKLLGQLLSSSTAKGLAGGLAGGMASKMVSKKAARKLGKNALKLGGVAAVGALAYTAYKRYNNNPQGQTQAQATTPNVAQPTQTPAELLPAPQNSAFLPDLNNQVASNQHSLTLVRAMIAAARADGQMDMQESQIIFDKIESLGLDDESRNLLLDEMNHPVNMDTIIQSATTPEVAAEIYTASLLAVDVDTAAEKGYLNMLAARLKLPAALTAEIEQQVDAQRVTVS
ncbi:MAG: tellurite resistance TerB family protein [Thiolinea sp.]